MSYWRTTPKRRHTGGERDSKSGNLIKEHPRSSARSYATLMLSAPEGAVAALLVQTKPKDVRQAVDQVPVTIS
jgi:hypothetical protein